MISTYIFYHPERRKSSYAIFAPIFKEDDIMAKAKKLKSGSWRCLVYDYTNASGKRIYKSFTCSDPSPAGKRKAEFEAAAYAEEKERISKSTNTMVFKDALDLYINERSSVLSPASIRNLDSRSLMTRSELVHSDLHKFPVA